MDYMLHHLLPTAHAPDVFSIDYAFLRQQGFKAVIFDIDNTLVYHGTGPTDEIDNLFQKIHSLGLKIFLISNNSEERIHDFNKNINTGFIAMAEKPKPHSYIQALKILKISSKDAVYIGDQIFTDILGANRTGIRNILVDFIRLPEEKYFGKKRQVEKLIIKIFHLLNPHHRDLGNILTKEVSSP